MQAGISVIVPAPNQGSQQGRRNDTRIVYVLIGNQAIALVLLRRQHLHGRNDPPRGGSGKVGPSRTAPGDQVALFG